MHDLDLITSRNKLNEANPEYTTIPITSIQTMESLCSLWGNTIQAAVQKFAGHFSQHPPTSEQVKVCSLTLIELHYTNIYHLSSDRSHLYAKHVSKDLSCLMKTYCFLSKHLKLDMQFLHNGSIPPSKNPSDLLRRQEIESECFDLQSSSEDTVLDVQENDGVSLSAKAEYLSSFVLSPSRSICPRL